MAAVTLGAVRGAGLVVEPREWLFSAVVVCWECLLLGYV